MGFAEFDAQKKDLYQLDKTYTYSFILNNNNAKDCLSALCKDAYQTLVLDNKCFIITDVEEYAKKTNNNCAHAKSFKTRNKKLHFSTGG